MPVNSNVTGTNLLSMLSDTLSNFYDNVLDTEVYLTVVKSRYVKGLCQIMPLL